MSAIIDTFAIADAFASFWPPRQFAAEIDATRHFAAAPRRHAIAPFRHGCEAFMPMSALAASRRAPRQTCC